MARTLVRMYVVALLGSTLVVVVPGPARAQPGAAQPAPADERAAQARATFEEGRVRFRAAEYDQALALFEQAYKQKPLPLLLYNIAQAARLGGKFELALDAYRRYLIALPDAPERPLVERNIAELDTYVQTHAKPTQPPPAQTIVVAPAPEPLRPPPVSHKRLWIGLGIGGALVVGGAVALGVIFGPLHGAPSSDLGTYHPYAK